MTPREVKGKQIAQKQNQIIRIDETHYKVDSQSRDKQHDVISLESGWSCSCEDRFFRKTCCKHIHAVEISLNVHQKVKDDVVISEVVINCCKYCKSQNIVKRGIRKNKSGNIQVFCCKDCTRKFSFNLGFEKMRATPDQITMAMNELMVNRHAR